MHDTAGGRARATRAEVVAVSWRNTADSCITRLTNVSLSFHGVAELLLRSSCTEWSGSWVSGVDRDKAEERATSSSEPWWTHTEDNAISPQLHSTPPHPLSISTSTIVLYQHTVAPHTPPVVLPPSLPRRFPPHSSHSHFPFSPCLPPAPPLSSSPAAPASWVRAIRHIVRDRGEGHSPQRAVDFPSPLQGRRPEGLRRHQGTSSTSTSPRTSSTWRPSWVDCTRT